MELSGKDVSAAVSLWPADTCLMSQLAAELAELPQASLRRCHIILPTKRLVIWLMALLARQRPAFIPPRCFTLEDFIRGHGEAANEPALGVLSDLGQELLLASILKEQGYKHLRLGHEHEVKQFLAELTDWNRGLQAIDDLAAHVAQNIYLSEGGVDTLGERFAELKDLAERFYSRCVEDLSAEPEGRQLSRLSAALAQSLSSSSYVLPWEQLYIVGLSSAQGMHEALFQALSLRPEVRFWLNEPPALSGQKNPLSMLLAMISHDHGAQSQRRLAQRAGASSAEALDEPAPSNKQPQGAKLTIARADSLLGEVAHAIQTAEAAVAAGLAPSSVALLVTNDVAYGKPLRALLQGSKLAPNLAIGTPLAQTELGTWLSALLELLSSDQSTSRQLGFLTHPLTLNWWQAAVTDPEAQANTSAMSLSAQLCSWDEPHRLFELPELVTAELKPFCTEILTTLGPLVPRPKAPGLPFSAWAAALHRTLDAFLGDITASYGGPKDDRGLMVSALRCLSEFLNEVVTMARHVRFSQREFLTTVKERLLTLDVRSIGDPLRGLQVLSLAEARYVPFDLGIILGCTEGDFPRALPRDHLVDHYLKVKIGLPGWHLLEAIEDTTFHLLKARLPAMMLLYPETRGGEPVVRSRFIESALALERQSRSQSQAMLPCSVFWHQEARVRALRLGRRPHSYVEVLEGRSTEPSSTLCSACSPRRHSNTFWPVLTAFSSTD